ncbi:MAG TPA: DNRLRE domain-containing protein, partial [candidate division Zixibacteria bacterium]|nr:DNRLRE domain-containing protein [candidate division Zixibacteria bacterium]
MNKQNNKNWAPLRAITRKPVLVLALLLLCVAVISAAVQADEVDNEDKRPDLTGPVVVSETRGPEGTNVVVTIPVAQDAFLSSANPSTAYGLWTTLRLGYDQTTFHALRFLLQWNMSSIPPNAIINNATASIYQTSVIPSGDVLAVQGQYVTAPWNESSVTWNNANYLGGDITQVGDVNANLGWKSVNVTDIVRTW